jgi:hypothetical protein
MLHSGKIDSDTEIERSKFSQEQRRTKFQCYRYRMFQHPLERQTGVPATYRGKGKNKFPIPTEYCHQPTIEADRNLASVPKTIEVVINIDPQGLC